MSDDGAAIIDNTFRLASELLGLFESGPNVDEQVFDQIVELRQQVEDLRVEMHERFDRIDQQLNTMFDTMMVGFNAIGNQVGDMEVDIGEADSPDYGADRSFNVNHLDDMLINLLEDEIEAGLQSAWIHRVHVGGVESSQR